MSGLIALIPAFVAPDAPDVVPYGDDDVITDDQLQRCGFFTPHYMGPGPNSHLMAQMPNLRCAQLLTAGYEHSAPFLPPGVTLSNAVGVHDAGTAELAIGLILARLRGIDVAARAMTTSTWLHERHVSLADRTVLVIGAGGVGSAIARRVAAFDAEATLVGRTRRGDIAGADELPDLLPNADIVVIAVPHTKDTDGMVDAAFLARMRDGAMLVNVARGPIVRTADLMAELHSARLQAALDVTDPEPLPQDHPLWRCPNLLITGHLGGNNTSFPPRATKLLVAQLEHWRAGEPLDHIVATG